MRMHAASSWSCNSLPLVLRKEVNFEEGNFVDKIVKTFHGYVFKDRSHPKIFMEKFSMNSV